MSHNHEKEYRRSTQDYSTRLAQNSEKVSAWIESQPQSQCQPRDISQDSNDKSRDLFESNEADSETDSDATDVASNEQRYIIYSIFINTGNYICY